MAISQQAHSRRDIDDVRSIRRRCWYLPTTNTRGGRKLIFATIKYCIHAIALKTCINFKVILSHTIVIWNVFSCGPANGLSSAHPCSSRRRHYMRTIRLTVLSQKANMPWESSWWADRRFVQMPAVFGRKIRSYIYISADSNYCLISKRSYVSTA